MTSGKLHFRVCGEGIVDICRQIYHFEDDKVKALDIMSCFDTLTIGNVYRVLNGDAKLVTSDDGESVIYIPEEDLEFKAELLKREQCVERIKRLEEEELLNEDGNMAYGVPCQDNATVLTEAQTLYGIKAWIEKETGKSCDGFLNKLDLEAATICDVCKENPDPDYQDCKYRTFSTCMRFKQLAVEAYPVKEPYENDKGEMVIDFVRIPVSKKLIDNYTDNIITRLKKTNTNPKDRYDFWCDAQDNDDGRRELHYTILKAAGFDRYDMEPAAMAFRAVVENYIEKRVHLLGGF